MADTGAPWNLPYPLPTDLVRDGAQAIQDLAEATADGLDAAGGLVSVHTSVRSTSFTTTSTSFVDVTGFAVTMTPADASHDIVIMLLVNRFANSNASAATCFQINDGSSDLLPGTLGIITTIPGAGFAQSGAGGIVVSAGTTTSRTYQVRISSPSATTASVDGATLIVYEVKV